MDWLFNLPVLGMTLVVLAAVYAATAAIYLLVTRLAVGERARVFKAVSPGMLPPLAKRLHFRDPAEVLTGLRSLDFDPTGHALDDWVGEHLAVVCAPIKIGASGSVRAAVSEGRAMVPAHVYPREGNTDVVILPDPHPSDRTSDRDRVYGIVFQEPQPVTTPVSQTQEKIVVNFYCPHNGRDECGFRTERDRRTAQAR